MQDSNRNQVTIGVFWKTNIMCKAFRRFRSILSIDAIKLQMNSFHYPYSSPVVLDREWQITPIFEMLSLSESFESYYFALNFMFDLEPYMQMKLGVIFSECGINESILPQIGLSQEWCHILWNHLNLDVKNWPSILCQFLPDTP